MGRVHLEVTISQTNACESQKQLHYDGLHYQHCVCCCQKGEMGKMAVILYFSDSAF